MLLLVLTLHKCNGIFISYPLHECNEEVTVTVKKSRLQRLRTSKKFTMGALSRASGISAATISRIESGTQTPGSNVLLKLSAALGVTPNDIIG
jgi:DNA-binding Xre family transcriptional regulator